MATMTYLEDVKAFVLNHSPIVTQLIHDEFEILARTDVARHDVVKLSIEQNLAEQFYALAFGDIAGRFDQCIVVSIKEEIEICSNERGDHWFVLDENLLTT